MAVTQHENAIRADAAADVFPVGAPTDQVAFFEGFVLSNAATAGQFTLKAGGTSGPIVLDVYLGVNDHADLPGLRLNAVGGLYIAAIPAGGIVNAYLRQD